MARLTRKYGNTGIGNRMSLVPIHISHLHSNLERKKYIKKDALKQIVFSFFSDGQNKYRIYLTWYVFGVTGFFVFSQWLLMGYLRLGIVTDPPQGVDIGEKLV